jgi:hypothetical protein
MDKGRQDTRLDLLMRRLGLGRSLKSGSEVEGEILIIVISNHSLEGAFLTRPPFSTSKSLPFFHPNH